MKKRRKKTRIKIAIPKTVKHGAGWSNLGHAIISQAAIDYATAYARLQEPDIDEWSEYQYMRQIESCDKFFESGWCEFLSDTDTKWLREEIRRIVDAKIADKKRQ